MPPQEPDAWEGVRECSTYGPVAKQIVSWIADSLMNEKELFSLNVWTPGISDEKKGPLCCGCMEADFMLEAAAIL